MSKNRGKSKLSKNVLFNANKHVFHCEKSLATLLYGQPLYIYVVKLFLQQAIEAHRVGCVTLRLPHFLDNRLTDGVVVLSLTQWLAALYQQKDSWYTCVSEACVDPWAILQLDGLGQFKSQ
jgi:hypothetical protein